MFGTESSDVSVVWHTAVPERPRGRGTVVHFAEQNKSASSSGGGSHRRDSHLLCGQCEQKLAHVVSIFTIDTTGVDTQATISSW